MDSGWYWVNTTKDDDPTIAYYSLQENNWSFNYTEELLNNTDVKVLQRIPDYAQTNS